MPYTAVALSGLKFSLLDPNTPFYVCHIFTRIVIYTSTLDNFIKTCHSFESLFKSIPLKYIYKKRIISRSVLYKIGHVCIQKDINCICQYVFILRFPLLHTFRFRNTVLPPFLNIWHHWLFFFIWLFVFSTNIYANSQIFKLDLRDFW